MPITSNEISVEVNGQVYTLPAGSTLGDALKVSRAPYIAGAAIGILKKAAEKRTEKITEYAINTPKGELRIEIKDPESTSGKLWAEHYKEYEGKDIHWESPEALAFGPFEADIKPSRETGNFEAFDVLFGAGGFDPHNTHLIMSRKRHSAEYGSPDDGVFASIVTGRKIISKISKESANSS